MLVVTTQSGRYIVFDVTEYRPGIPVPPIYNFFAEGGKKPFFYEPLDWFLRGERPYPPPYSAYPMMFSEGYATQDEALRAAEKTEAMRDSLRAKLSRRE